jgi:dipeptidyl aminopeptidase/acylaminoacyl peptidase
LPNYTGSIGYGSKHVDALVGKCGELDVADIIDSIKALVECGKAMYGKGRQYILGGSHGGFIGAHRKSFNILLDKS